MDFKDYFELTQLYAEYGIALDAADWDAWPEFFVDDCVYKLQPRENHERGFPLATLAFDSKGMLKDRVYGIKETLFHDPYYQRHVIGTPVIRKLAPDGRIHAEASYAVLRTRLSKESTVLNVGRTIDEIVRTPAGLKFASRLVVYDSEMIPNSLIYPI
jgi:salicylate 5-hydroxylase small subunit